MDWLDRALGAFGKIRFGPGVLGRLGLVLGIGIVVLGSLGWAIRTDGAEMVLQIVYVIAGLIVLFVVGGFFYAHLHPEAAALESAHYTKIAMHKSASNVVPMAVQHQHGRLAENPEVIELLAKERRAISDV